jgi:hypothetical protein
MSAMKNQWKTSSMYINNNSTERVPDETPVEFIPGSTASGIRRLHRAELTLPYGQKTTSMQWPPPITPVRTWHKPVAYARHLRSLPLFARVFPSCIVQANVPATIGSYQQLTYGGPHLRTFPPGAIAAGLGGIDPTQ